jgi:osmotically-inducible protein OsmY
MHDTACAFDDKLALAIESAPHLAASRLRVESQEGRVYLRGKVASYFQKQMAQEAIRRIDGVEWIENELEVGDSI